MPIILSRSQKKKQKKKPAVTHISGNAVKDEPESLAKDSCKHSIK